MHVQRPGLLGKLPGVSDYVTCRYGQREGLWRCVRTRQSNSASSFNVLWQLLCAAQVVTWTRSRPRIPAAHFRASAFSSLSVSCVSQRLVANDSTEFSLFQAGTQDRALVGGQRARSLLSSVLQGSLFGLMCELGCTGLGLDIQTIAPDEV